MHTSIQDGGRLGMETYGIPESGFLDQHAGRLANQLVGNPIGAPLLEITGVGPILEFNQTSTFAFTGGNFSPSINGQVFPMNEAITVKKNQQLTIGPALWGFRGYLAVKGQLDCEYVYESHATNFQSKFGGYHGRILRKDDMLQVKKTLIKVSPLKMLSPRLSDQVSCHTIRLCCGPEIGLLSKAHLTQFSDHQFKVSNQSNRMGYRLSGDWTDSPLDLNTIISSGNVRGVVQLPPSLTPIILLNDAGTTGGYPRIGVCENPDLIAQIKPGDKIRFQWI